MQERTEAVYFIQIEERHLKRRNVKRVSLNETGKMEISTAFDSTFKYQASRSIRRYQ